MLKWIARTICVISLAFTLAACATTAGYEEILDSWVGSTEDQLVDSWGPPDGFYEGGGKKYLTYVYSSSGYTPGLPATSSMPATPGYSYSYNCKTTFTVIGNEITNWRYKGNACWA